jgi:hypothetical protein
MDAVDLMICLANCYRAVPKKIHKPKILDLAEVASDTPLRLKVAAQLVFPDGSMSASGLRREASKGRLTVERIAGKDYTTIDSINLMRKRCRVQAKERDYGCDPLAAKPVALSRTLFGSLSMANGISPRDALEARLAKQKSVSPRTSLKSTLRPGTREI